MKHHLVLIIYILISSKALCQKKYLETNFHSKLIQEADSSLTMQLNGGLKKTKDSITASLFKKGYFNHIIYTSRKLNDSTFSCKIILNKKYEEIHFENFIEKELLEQSISLSRKRNNIPVEELESYLRATNKQLNDKGFPFATTRIINIKLDTSKTVKADLKIQLNSKRFIDNVIIKGYKNFPKKTIREFINSHNLYSTDNILSIENYIKDLGFVNVVKTPEVLFKKDSTSLYLFLEKKNNNYAEGLLGFNNSDNGKVELNGYLNLNLENNLNNAESFKLEYRNDNEDQIQLTTSFNIPYLWKSSIGTKAEIQLLRRDSTYQRTSFTTGVYFKPSWHTSIGINYKNTTSDGINGEIEIGNLRTNGIELDALYQKRSKEDLNPEDIILEFKIGAYNRNLENKNENQYTIDATIVKLLHLNNRSKFLGLIRGRYLKSDNIQFNELYQFGGLGSIRGFNQNSIDSSFYTTLATEYRYCLNSQIYLHSILDIGIFENFNSKKLDRIYGYGAGIAILTNAGVLNLSVANGRFNSAKVDLSSTVAHINLRINF